MVRVVREGEGGKKGLSQALKRGDTHWEGKKWAVEA